MKNKLLIILMLTCFFYLTGCSSEIDKCTDAFVKSMGPYSDSEEKNATEADVRLMCLKASTGKK